MFDLELPSKPERAMEKLKLPSPTRSVGPDFAAALKSKGVLKSRARFSASAESQNLCQAILSAILRTACSPFDIVSCLMIRLFSTSVS